MCHFRPDAVTKQSNQLSNLGKVTTFYSHEEFIINHQIILSTFFFNKETKFFFNALSSSRTRCMQRNLGAISAFLLSILLRVYIY